MKMQEDSLMNSYGSTMDIYIQDPKQKSLFKITSALLGQREFEFAISLLY